MDSLITLSIDGAHGHATAEVDPLAGCRIAQLTVRNRPVLIDPGARPPRSTGWGSFPMAPWAGRIRHGRFTLFGVDHQLALDHQDGGDDDPERRHAIHGTVLGRPWTIEHVTEAALTASCALSSGDGSGWTFGGTARQTIELLDGQLCCHLSIEVDHHADHHPGHHPSHDTAAAFMGEIGWHPWFRKPDRLDFHPDAMYERDAIGLPTGRLVAPSDGPWDDCFVNTAPVTLHYDTAPGDTASGAATLTLSSDCDHWVIYDEPADATCVEPQSGPPDAFNIRPRLVTATHPLRRTMNIAW